MVTASEIMNTLAGMGEDWMSEPDFTPADFIPYKYPSLEEFEAHNIQIVFLGWTMKTWGQLENGVFSSLVGLESRTDDPSNTADLTGMTSLDEGFVILNQMIKYYKYGFGRATDFVNEWIRSGKVSRDEGIKIVKKFDGTCSENYINDFCTYIEISKQQFWNVVNEHTNKSLFSTKKGSRPIPLFQVRVGYA